ncbi:MAG: M24 family metallopeptidase [Acidimicrobiales bacterium]
MTEARPAAVGVAAVPEGGRIDFDRLRADRHRRLLAAMGEDGLDALILGRPANIAFASGARQLWTAGARPFGPGCVVVAATGRVHLLSVWDEGVPAEIGHDDLYGLSWNPANLLKDLQAIEGLSGCRSVATDGLSPGFRQFLAAIAPEAQVVDGGPALRRAREPKSVDEIACIETAAAVAEAALAAMVDALGPGITERGLRAVYAETVARLGSPTPPSEAVATVVGPAGAASGDVVALHPGAMYAGYEAGIGRSWHVPGSRVRPDAVARAELAHRRLEALVGSCIAGASGDDLLAACHGAGGRTTAEPLAMGLGLGVEAPVISTGIGGHEILRAGQVLLVQAGAGELVERETVLVTDGAPQVLTAFGRDRMLSA